VWFWVGRGKRQTHSRSPDTGPPPRRAERRTKHTRPRHSPSPCRHAARTGSALWVNTEMRPGPPVRPSIPARPVPARPRTGQQDVWPPHVAVAQETRAGSYATPSHNDDVTQRRLSAQARRGQLSGGGGKVASRRKGTGLAPRRAALPPACRPGMSGSAAGRQLAPAEVGLGAVRFKPSAGNVNPTLVWERCFYMAVLEQLMLCCCFAFWFLF